MTVTRRLAVLLAVLALVALAAPTATADAPARVRELTCSDGTTFTGQFVNIGIGAARDPQWRNVEPGAFPAAFVYLANTVTAPDGTVVTSWDHTQGVAHKQELVTCSLIIPVGPLTGYRADFVGFFVPA